MLSAKGLQEAEIREGLGKGGRIQGLFVVERPGCEGERSDYVVYIRPSWTRGYRILRTWRDKGDRAFRDFDRLLQAVRALGYDGPVTVYTAGYPELARFRGVLTRDGGTKEGHAEDASVFNKPHGTEEDDS